MGMCFKILLLAKHSFDLRGTGNRINRMEHFENWWSDLNTKLRYCRWKKKASGTSVGS